MSKKSNHDKIMTSIKKREEGYKILNKSGARAIHVRVNDFGDVWPSTGTAKLSNGKWIKKSVEEVLTALNYGEIAKPKEDKKPKDSRIQELEERVCWLESDNEKIRAFLNITN